MKALPEWSLINQIDEVERFVYLTHTHTKQKAAISVDVCI